MPEYIIFSGQEEDDNDYTVIEMETSFFSETQFLFVSDKLARNGIDDENYIIQKIWMCGILSLLSGSCHCESGLVVIKEKDKWDFLEPENNSKNPLFLVELNLEQRDQFLFLLDEFYKRGMGESAIKQKILNTGIQIYLQHYCGINYETDMPSEEAKYYFMNDNGENQ